MTVLLVLLAASSAMAAARQTPEEIFRSAGAAYSAARYNEAVRMYEDLLAQGFTNVDVYSNLGSAYFKNGSIARGILNFERARRLAPSDPSVLHNLAVAQSRMRDRVMPMPLLFAIRWWNQAKSSHTASRLFWWTVVLAWFVALAVFVFFGFGGLVVRRVALASGIAGVACLALSIFLYLDKTEDLETRREAVILPVQVTVRSAPDASGVESFTIHEGLGVEILEARGQWDRIRLADGKDGWVPSEAVERI